MPYIKEICVAGETIEVRKYHTHHARPPGTKREKKGEITPDRILKANHRTAERKLRRLMNNNFKDGDFLLRLDFSKDSSPSGSSDMQKEMQNFIRRLKTRYRKHNKELKYIYVKEIGSRGGRHAHMVINKCDTEWIRESWRVGGIHIDPLYSHGQYAQIASYFMKYALRSEETEGQLIGKRYYASRNLIPPKVTKEEIKAGRFSKKIREKKGYFLDKDSVREGINDLTGYEYFCYTLIKIQTPKRGG